MQFRICSLIAIGILQLLILSAISLGKEQSPPSRFGRWDRFVGGGTYQWTHPTVSLDGAVVVYSTPATGHGDLYSFNRQTGKNIRLTSNPDLDGDPCYSKDGKKIVFIREKAGIAHLWRMEPDGSHQEQLTDGPTDDASAAFSGDGKLIAFTRTRNGVAHLWTMDTDGGHQKQLTEGSWADGAPMFSPDGSKIYFDREFPRGAVKERFGPIVDKDSLRFPEIFSLKLNGTGEQRLTHNLHTDTPVGISLDGKRLFYWRNDNYQIKSPFVGIAVLNTDGTGSRNLCEGSTPAFSPDMRQLAFICGPYGREIGLMNTDGSGVRKIHVCKFYHTEPIFSSDGSHLIFVEWPDEHGSGRIIVQNLKTLKIEWAPKID